MRYSLTRKWTVTVSCFLINFVHLGVNRTSGMLYPAVMERYNVGRSAAALPFAISFSMRHLTGPIASFLSKRYGLRAMTLFGNLLSSIAFAACFFVEDMLLFTIFYGVIYGIGLGFGTMLLPEILTEHFHKKISVPYGISVGGSCVSGFMLPAIIGFLLRYYGVSGIMLCLASFALQIVPAAMLLWPPRKTLIEMGFSEEPVYKSDNTERNLEDFHSKPHIQPQSCLDMSSTTSKGVARENYCSGNPDSSKHSLSSLDNGGSEIQLKPTSSPSFDMEGQHPVLDKSNDDICNQRMCHTERYGNDNIFAISKGMFLHLNDKDAKDASTCTCAANDACNQNGQANGRELKITTFIETLHEREFSRFQERGFKSYDLIRASKTHDRVMLSNIFKLSGCCKYPNTRRKSRGSNISYGKKLADRGRSRGKDQDQTTIDRFESLNNKTQELRVSFRNDNTNQSQLNTEQQSHGEFCDKRVKTTPSHVRRTLGIFFDLAFLLVLFSNSFSVCIYTFVCTIAVDFVRDCGIQDGGEEYILMAMSAGDAIGRFFSGFVADYGYLTNSQFSALSNAATSAVLICIIEYNSFAVLLISFSLLGLAYGITNSTGPGMCSENIEREHLSIALASRYILHAPLNLLQSPLIELFRVSHGSYVGLIAVLVVVSFLCSLASGLTAWAAKRRTKKEDPSH